MTFYWSYSSAEADINLQIFTEQIFLSSGKDHPEVQFIALLNINQFCI